MLLIIDKIIYILIQLIIKHLQTKLKIFFIFLYKLFCILEYINTFVKTKSKQHGTN